MMAMKRHCLRGIWCTLVIVAQLSLVSVALAQSEVANAAPPGGSLLVLLMGLGAIILVGLTFIVRERLGGTNLPEDGAG